MSLAKTQNNLLDCFRNIPSFTTEMWQQSTKENCLHCADVFFTRTWKKSKVIVYIFVSLCIKSLPRREHVTHSWLICSMFVKKHCQTPVAAQQENVGFESELRRLRWSLHTPATPVSSQKHLS